MSGLDGGRPEHKSDFDGDEMHLLSIKEMGIVPELMKIHPSRVLLGSADSLISADTRITTQAAQALNARLVFTGGK